MRLTWAPPKLRLSSSPPYSRANGHALGDGLVDDVHRQLGEAVDVALAGAEVAALDRVVEQPMDAVAVAAVVLRRVDPALGGDRVGAARRVVERERLDLVAELGERGRRRRPGETGADDEDLELALVVRVDQLGVGDVAVPLVGERSVGTLSAGVLDADVVAGVDGSAVRVISRSVDDAGLHGDGERDVADDDQRGDADGRGAAPLVEPW